MGGQGRPRLAAAARSERHRSTGAGATGGIVALPPGGGTTSSVSWYDTLTAADCSAAPTALPSTRIWRLSATQWQNTVASALGVSPPDVSAFPPDQTDPRTGYSDDSTGDKITLPLARPTSTRATRSRRRPRPRSSRRSPASA